MIANSRAPRYLAVLSFLACLVLYAAALALFWHNQPAPDWRLAYDWEIAGMLSWALLYPAMGVFIVFHHPGHRIGWLFCGIGLVGTFTTFATQYVIFGLVLAPDLPPRVAEFNWLRNFAWQYMVLLIALLFLYFPDGHLPSRGWRWLVRLLAVIAAYVVLAAYFGGWEMRGNAPLLADAMSPAGDAGASVLWNGLAAAGVVALFLALLAAAVSLLFRWRLSNRVVRQQLKWFMLAGLFFAAYVLAGEVVMKLLFPGTRANVIASAIFGGLTTAVIPVTIAAAIIRHRLYDIDVIIRKTLVYGVLSALLALTYFGSVVLFQGVIEAVSGEQSPIGIVVSTLVIAALFNPLRLRVQDFIDRRFYRRKYDAQRMLAQFALKSREEVELDGLTVEVLRVVAETMQPAWVSVWLRPDGKR